MLLEFAPGLPQNYLTTFKKASQWGKLSLILLPKCKIQSMSHEIPISEIVGESVQKDAVEVGRKVTLEKERPFRELMQILGIPESEKPKVAGPSLRVATQRHARQRGT